MNLEQRNGVAMTQEFTKPGMSFEILRQEVDGDTAYILWKAEAADIRKRVNPGLALWSSPRAAKP
jgi:hypothetical protein